jgi:hypothetical protein
VSELKERLGENLQALILYGSYTYQDLTDSVDTFKRLKGKKGLLDKKPDFVAVIRDLEAAIQEINNVWLLKEMRNRWLAKLRPDTPFYFNCKTENRYPLVWKGRKKNVRLPFKIGLIGREEFKELHDIQNDNLYLFCRMSKPVNIIDNSMDGILESQIDRSRDYLLDLTLSTLPRRFSGKQLVERYSAITYWCEAFRFFDIARRRKNRRYLSLLKDRFYDTSKKAISDMRLQIQGIITARFQKRKDVKEIAYDHDFYKCQFVKRERGLTPEEIVSRFMPINVFSAYASVCKNWLTTGPLQGVVYTLRKVFRI